MTTVESPTTERCAAPGTGPAKASPLHGIVPKICETRYGPIEYADFGCGPVVVAIHGAMGGWDQSAILARSALRGNFRVLAISRPGYLGTPYSSGVTPSQQADLLAALLDSLAVPTAAILAISGGGPCALAFALGYPERCSRLVLISSCSIRNTVKIPLSFHLMKALARVSFVVEAMKRKALGNLERSLERSIQDVEMRERMLTEPEVMALYRALMASTFDRMAERIKGTDNDIRITQTTEWPLEQIKTPTLVIHGTADRVAPYDLHAGPFASRIPGARLITVPGGEHVTLFTHCALVRSEVTAFLS